MTPAEYAEMVGYLETHWGNLHRGWVGREDVLYSDFRVYPGALAMDAVRELFYGGSNTCPAPSKVVAQVRMKTSALGAISTGTDFCDGHHIWAFADTVKGKREAECVRCKETRTFDEDELRTPTELNDAPAKPPPEAPY